MTADWRWITDVSQSGGPDSRPRLEGVRYKYLTSCSRLLSPPYPIQSRIHSHTSLTETPPLPGLAQWACYKGLSIRVQSRLDPCPKDDDLTPEEGALLPLHTISPPLIPHMRRNMKHQNLLVFSHDIGEDVNDNEDTVSISTIIISFVHVCRTSLSVGQLLGKIFIIDLLARFCVHLLLRCPVCASFCRMLLSAQPSVSPELN